MLQFETFPSHIFLTPAVKSQNYHKQTPPTSYCYCRLLQATVPVWPPLSQVDPLFIKWGWWKHTAVVSWHVGPWSSVALRRISDPLIEKLLLSFTLPRPKHIALAPLRPAHSDTLSGDNGSGRFWRGRPMIWELGSPLRPSPKINNNNNNNNRVQDEMSALHPQYLLSLALHPNVAIHVLHQLPLIRRRPAKNKQQTTPWRESSCKSVDIWD